MTTDPPARDCEAAGRRPGLRITLTESCDTPLLLRVVAVLHKRGVLVTRLDFDAVGARIDVELTPGNVTLATVAHSLEFVVGVLGVDAFEPVIACSR